MKYDETNGIYVIVDQNGKIIKPPTTTTFLYANETTRDKMLNSDFFIGWCKDHGIIAEPKTLVMHYVDKEPDIKQIYAFAKAGQMVNHKFTDDVAITIANSKEEAIKNFSRYYREIKDKDVFAVHDVTEGNVKILTDY